MGSFDFDLDAIADFLDAALATPELLQDPQPELCPDRGAAPPTSSDAIGGTGELHYPGNAVLNNISEMLMSDGSDEKLDGLLESSPELRATEKSLYEALGESSSSDRSPAVPEARSRDLRRSGAAASSSRAGHGPPSKSFTIDFSSPSSFSSPDIDDSRVEPRWASQCKRGIEEAQKYLINEHKLLVKFEVTGFSLDHQSLDSRTRKASSFDPEDQRENKHSALSTEVVVRSEAFDEILLANPRDYPFTMEAAEEKGDENLEPSSNCRGHGGGAAMGKSPTTKAVELNDLLIQCSEAVSNADHRSAESLLKRIRSQTNPCGEAAQRVAHYFADGLEARLAGTGGQVYRSLVARRKSSAEVLKAHHLYLFGCPFKRMGMFFSGRTIYHQAETASRLHIVDFGIYYGFQWPCLMQFLATRPGGPPKLKITGIELPNTGFRPSEILNETGNRLADYARSFAIPFEFYPIAAKWESIKPDHIRTEQGEMLVINCMLGLHNLADESAVSSTAAASAVIDCPRNRVLSTMRKLNPDMLIVSIKNGAYGEPFFANRFKEVLYTYSSLFDMVAANVPADEPERLIFERDLLGMEILNVIACEGSDRVVRPENYKQCAARIRRAGFEQLPLMEDMVEESMLKVKKIFNKHFLLDQDSNWLLQGWKGRIAFGLSCWKPQGA